MGLFIEEIMDSGAVAFKEDAVGRRIDGSATLPDDTSGTMALIAYEQSGEEERTHLAINAFEQRVSHDNGFVATDRGYILLTQDGSLIGSRRNHPHIRAVVAGHRYDTVGRFIDFRIGGLFLHVQLINLAQHLTGVERLEQVIQGQETSADKGCIIVTGLDADTGGPPSIVGITDSHFGSPLLIEGTVHFITVILHTTLDFNHSLILNSTLWNFIDYLRVGRRRNPLAQDGLRNLLCHISLLNAGVAVDLHLQLDHSTQIGRDHEVGAVLLGKCYGIINSNATYAFLDQIRDCLAEVCFQHASFIIQIVQIQIAQHTRINRLGGHDMLNEHMSLINVCPCGF